MDLSQETKSQVEQLIQNVTALTEVALELREKSIHSDKYSSYLRSLAWRANRASSIIQQTSRNCLSLSQRLATSCSKTLNFIPDNALLRQQIERLLFILEKELIDIVDFDLAENPFSYNLSNPNNLNEKLRTLESKVKNLDLGYVSQCSSAKSFKQDVDEKYPENCSRESLFDFNVMNLPPVPEDTFATFKSTASTSQSSLRSLRKVKLYLQKAASSDDSEDSETEDQDTSNVSGEGRHLSCWDSMKHVSKRKMLGNIKEESSSQDERQ